MDSNLVSAEPQSTHLATYEAACLAVTEAKNVFEAKDIRDKSEAMRVYQRQAKNKQLETDAAEIRIRAERKIGQLMQMQREAGLMNTGTAGTGNSNVSGGSPQDPPEETTDKQPTLEEAGIDKHLADRARKSAAIPDEEFETIVDDWRDDISNANERVTVNIIAAAEKSKVRGTQGTGDNEWYTPSQFHEAARTVMGGISLDPASCEYANESIRADSIFTCETNGLDKDWIGNIWLNPPYSQPLISQFMEKLRDEFDSGNVRQAITLTHNYTDTRWFQDSVVLASAVCFTRGRVKFYSQDGDIAAPTQGQAFLYFGPNKKEFLAEFKKFGFVAEVLA